MLHKWMSLCILREASILFSFGCGHCCNSSYIALRLPRMLQKNHTRFRSHSTSRFSFGQRTSPWCSYRSSYLFWTWTAECRVLPAGCGSRRAGTASMPTIVDSWQSMVFSSPCPERATAMITASWRRSSAEWKMKCIMAVKVITVPLKHSRRL